MSFENHHPNGAPEDPPKIEPEAVPLAATAPTEVTPSIKNTARGTGDLLVTPEGIPLKGFVKERVSVTKDGREKVLETGVVYFIADENDGQFLLAHLPHKDFSVGWVSKELVQTWKTREVLLAKDDSIEKVILSRSEDLVTVYTPSTGQTTSVESSNINSLFYLASSKEFSQTTANLVKLHGLLDGGLVSFDDTASIIRKITEEYVFPEFVDLAYLRPTYELAKEIEEEKDGYKKFILTLKLKKLLKEGVLGQLSQHAEDLMVIGSESKKDESGISIFINPEAIERLKQPR